MALLGFDALALALMAVFAAAWDVDRAQHGGMKVPGELRASFTGIVLGCRVNGEHVSCCLEERLATALDLYRAGKVRRLLLTGDHGRKDYDEVNTMRAWLEQNGVPRAHIFTDHAGFDTYDSMVRAREVFKVKDAIVVSQRFHLPRALYLAGHAGLVVQATAADPEHGSCCAGSRWREHLARVKAVLDVRTGAAPRFLGPPIPITGDPAPSHDR